MKTKTDNHTRHHFYHCYTLMSTHARTHAHTHAHTHTHTILYIYISGSILFGELEMSNGLTSIASAKSIQDSRRSCTTLGKGEYVICEVNRLFPDQ